MYIDHIWKRFKTSNTRVGEREREIEKTISATWGILLVVRGALS